MSIVYFSCPQSLSQHFYWRLNECLIHWYGVAYSRASKQGSTSSRGVGVGHDPGIPWLWQVLHHPEQELVSGRGSFVADGWLCQCGVLSDTSPHTCLSTSSKPHHSQCPFLWHFMSWLLIIPLHNVMYNVTNCVSLRKIQTH